MDSGMPRIAKDGLEQRVMGGRHDENPCTGGKASQKLGSGEVEFVAVIRNVDPPPSTVSADHSRDRWRAHVSLRDNWNYGKRGGLRSRR